MSNGLFQEMPEMSKGGMSMEIRTIEEVRIYVLILNTFGAAEEGEVVAISNDYNKLVSWYKDQFNPEGEYRENGWTKTFRKGSLIEYNNPCRSIELNDTYPYGHGIHDEWIPIEQFYSLGNRYNVI